MATKIRNQKNRSGVNFVDLPEQILRAIFRYICAKDLHCNLRPLTPNIKKHVDEYLQCQATFALIRDPTMPSRLIYIFKREGKYFETYSTPANPLIKWGWSRSTYVGSKLDGLRLHSLPATSTDVHKPLLLGIKEIPINIWQ